MTIVQSRDLAIAPELDGAIAWLNVRRPVSLRDLRGQVVILDFWTYCCINCMHVVPTLRELERRYAGKPLTVIGVHSGKFAAEKDPERIREAVGRYAVEHPVAVDDDMSIWSRYGVRSWPTLVVVRPDGRIAAVAPGEPDLETLDALVAKLLVEGHAAGVVAEHTTPVYVAPSTEHEPLCYPGKAIVLPDGRLAVSDSGHHRVLVCRHDGQVEHSFGSGLRGYSDGAAADAAFDDPQGLCWHDGAMYVADVRNHAIRRLDLGAGSVSTVAGTGALGIGAPEGAVAATEIALRSPWDLCSVDDCIYVAMAGSHQIWRFWPAKRQIELYAGTGVEALIDGDVKSSAWAQPSGLAARGATLYVADSESSAVRAIDLERGIVTTIAGLGLFDFGDGEGEADGALLQHCLGVATDEADVLIADTYNGKIKRWTPRPGAPVRGSSRAVGTLRTVCEGLREPGSVAVGADGSLVIADTNAHRLLQVLDGQSQEIVVRGAPRAKQGALSVPPRGPSPKTGVSGWFSTLLELPESVGLPAGEGNLSVLLRSPEGLELAVDSPMTISLEVSRRSDLLMLRRARFELTSPGGASQIVSIEVHVLGPGAPRVEAEILATIDYVACNEADAGQCSPGRLHLRIPVRLLEQGTSRELAYEVELPRPGPG